MTAIVTPTEMGEPNYTGTLGSTSEETPSVPPAAEQDAPIGFDATGSSPPTTSEPTWDLDLSPQHQSMLENSAIGPEVARARGYRTVTTKAELKRLGFGDAQCRAPALLIPIRGVTGEIVNYQIRPDDPRISKGKPLKYETVGGSSMAIDVPQAARVNLRNPQVPLFITEGARKADAAVSQGLCCIALLGVWNFRGTNEHGGKTALGDWESIALNGRDVYVAFDSDVMLKPQVHKALGRLGALLTSRGARVHYIYLPPGDAGEKVGLDDFLAAGHDVADVMALASNSLRSAPGDGSEEGPYAVVHGRICHRQRTQNDDFWVPLANFNARIVEEVVADDGIAERGELIIEGTAADGTALGRARVPLERFPRMDWAVANWGSRAVVGAGFSTKDRLREAIQLLSSDVVHRREYAHSGWRRLDEHGWVYLHGAGAIGATGHVPDVVVTLKGSLGHFTLPDVADADALRGAVRACLGLIDVAPDSITVPLLGAVYRAPLNQVHYADTALALVGPTGVRKSELAALAQQHYGADFDRLHLPGSWSSTANALERLVFEAKDALVVIDDFAPAGSIHDIARYHATAERVIRGAGNAAGRGRMAADGSRRPEYPPRGLVLLTGEDVPKGESVRGRLVVLEINPDDVDLERLTERQQEARRGQYAIAMAGYVQYLASQMDVLPQELPEDFAAMRSHFQQPGLHSRTPDALTHLRVGWDRYLRFALDVGAVTPFERAVLSQRVGEALAALAAKQSEHQQAADPVQQYVDLLASAIVSGLAHVTDRNGDEPELPQAWGWRNRESRLGMVDSTNSTPQGLHIGWVEGDDLYLDPTAAYGIAQRVAQQTGTSLPVQPTTLHKRLKQRGLLRSTEDGVLTVRRSLSGTRRRVLHLSAETVVGQMSGQHVHRGKAESGHGGVGASASHLSSGQDGLIGQLSPDTHDTQGNADAQQARFTLDPGDIRVWGEV